MMSRSILACVLSICLCFHDTQATGFDCENAKTAGERRICKDPRLSALDDQMARAYVTALVDTPDATRTRDRQRFWLRQRDTCLNDASCRDIDDLYRDRMSELEQLAKPQARRKSTYIDRVAFDHVGQLKIGMSAARFEFLAGPGVAERGREDGGCRDTQFFRRDALPETPDSAGPFHWSPFGAQIFNGVVQRIDIMYDNRAETPEGIRLGSTEEDVKRAYGDRLLIGKWSIYGAYTSHARDPGRTGEGHAFLLMSPDRKLAILFETDGVQVNGIHVGLSGDFMMSPDGEIFAQTCDFIIG